MFKLIFIYFFMFAGTLSLGLWWARSHTAEVSVLELHWTRILGIQQCLPPDEGNRFLAGIAENQTCHWIWQGIRKASGTNNTPEWPSIGDLSTDYRVVIQGERYEGILKPIPHPDARWVLSSSDVSIYMRFLLALQTNSTVPRVRATFCQVEGI